MTPVSQLPLTPGTGDPVGGRTGEGEERCPESGEELPPAPARSSQHQPASASISDGCLRPLSSSSHPGASPVSSARPSLSGMSRDAGPGRPAGASIADTPITRLLAGVLSITLLGAVALPARRLGREAETRDSFPFSHYPMFSATRKAHY